MKRLLWFGLGIVSCVVLMTMGGCATVKVSTDADRTLVAAENTCWRVFWWLPIASGDCEDPNDDFCVWFRNTATLKSNMHLVEYAREKKGARQATNIHSYLTDDHFFFILRRTALHTSAELLY